MIAMWNEIFATSNPKIAEFFRELYITSNSEIVRQIYNAMHDYLAEVWD
jgi:DNA-binding FadR family transcriptional regulator